MLTTNFELETFRNSHRLSDNDNKKY